MRFQRVGRPPGLTWSIMLLAAAAAVACSPPEPAADAGSAGTPTAAASTAAPESTRTPAARTASEPPAQPDRIVEAVAPLPRQNAAESVPWEAAFVIPYGPGESALGASKFGPESAAVGADGTWWVLDTHKGRVARFDEHGRFLDAVAIVAEDETVGPQLPRVLDDGRFVATGSDVLIVDGADVERMPLPARHAGRYWEATDGQRLFRSGDGGVGAYALDLSGGAKVERADWFEGRGGWRYLVTMPDPHTLVVDFPDAPEPVQARIRVQWAGDPQYTVAPIVEHELDGNRVLHLLFYGTPEGMETTGVAGYLTVAPSGEVGEVLAVPPVFGDRDPGSMAHLRLRPGSSRPAVVTIDGDGLRVWKLDPAR